MSKRLDWTEYFLEMADLAAQRSTCIQRQVGAVLVKDNRVISTGYNGAPSGLHHCTEANCLRKAQNIPSGQRYELCRSVHAEQNAIIQAAKYGSNVGGATLYCTTQPCFICAKMLLNLGVERMVFTKVFEDPDTGAMMKEAGFFVATWSAPYTAWQKRINQ